MISWGTSHIIGCLLDTLSSSATFCPQLGEMRKVTLRQPCLFPCWWGGGSKGHKQPYQTFGKRLSKYQQHCSTSIQLPAEICLSNQPAPSPSHAQDGNRSGMDPVQVYHPRNSGNCLLLNQTIRPSKSVLSTQTGSSSPRSQAEVLYTTYCAIFFHRRCWGLILELSAYQAHTQSLIQRLSSPLLKFENHYSDHIYFTNVKMEARYKIACSGPHWRYQTNSHEIFLSDETCFFFSKWN